MKSPIDVKGSKKLGVVLPFGSPTSIPPFPARWKRKIEWAGEEVFFANRRKNGSSPKRARPAA